MLLKLYLFALIFVVVMLGGLKAVSDYLLYADKPVFADVVVLFVGPGFEHRLLKAQQLVHDGYADKIFIPAYHSEFQKTARAEIQRVNGNCVDGFCPTVKSEKKKYPNYYENTHIEIILAKKYMDKLGVNKALFVSSPYHMRRIKIITENKIYKNKIVYFVPFLLDEIDLKFNYENIKWMFLETSKLIWFYLYCEFNAVIDR